MSNATQAPEVEATGEELIQETATGLPPWLEVVFPWAASVTLHIGIGLLLGFLALVTYRATVDDSDREQIVIPSANYADPTLGPPGGVAHPGVGGDPTRDAAQNKVKNVLEKDGWASKQSDANATSFLEGDSSDAVADAIARGSGRSIGGVGKGGTGQGEGGPLAPYGTPGGGAGIGHKSNFYQLSGNGTKIVYILDHSGSLLDNFSFLQKEVNRSVGSLNPVQQFAVIVFAGMEEGVDVLGPPNLQRATTEAKRQFAAKMDLVVAKGKNDDQLEPFLTAFKTGLAMKPQLIYFLTDGKFDGRLIEEVKKLNADKKCRINTIAFVNDKEQDYQDQLRDLAKSNGGAFKFVSEKELGR